MPTIIAIIQALIAGVPRMIELIKAGRDPGSIRLAEVISTDALEQLRSARSTAQDFIDNG